MNKFYQKGLIALAFFGTFSVQSQNQKLLQSALVLDAPSGLMQLSTSVYEANAEAFLNSTVLADENMKVKKYKVEIDEIGYTHTKYLVMYKNAVIENAVIIVHAQYGKIVSINGDINAIQAPANSVAISEQTALQLALNKVNAKKYKWENLEEVEHMRLALNKPDFSFTPKAELVLFAKGGLRTASRYAYKFDIYAEEPLSRANIFVDAQSGKILGEQNILCVADVTATAVTKYSGTQTITTDNFGAGQYRLREVARGNGVETWNLKNTANYGAASDFTNSTTSWSTTSGVDQAAKDAHWGAEKTYDYFWTQHARNSIDGAGFKLLSYVHYNTNYNNAFWDGTRMTYGDGDGSTFTILTAIDVCGHEISHGLTSNTSNLTYSNESGALNESYSDIFGTCVENYGRPSNWNWKIGEDMTPSGNGIRNMQNPNLFSDPDTYLGTFWYTGTGDNGGVHTNSGVSNYWFYLLSMGGTGTNDIANSYTVTAITMAKAARIAFRANTVYYTPGTNYANARALSIQAAKDLYGNCSNEVVQTTNAWYAVGVGPAFSSTIASNFVAPNTSYCSVPANILFNNTTSNGITYTWTWGDGSVTTSTVLNASHTYTANGTYSVKLKSVGCLSVTDSITKTSYITIATPAAPTATGGATACGPGIVNLSASGSSQLYWYSTPSATGTPIGTGTSYTTPLISSNTTYYVVNTTTSAPVFGGPVTNLFGTGTNYNSSNAQYEIFDVFQPCTLKTVMVVAGVAGNRTIELRNSSNAVITSTTVNIPLGTQTVTVNIPLQVGTGWRLGLSGTSAIDLYRNNSGASYPYNVSGLVTITGSSAGSAYYYFYYNWQVQKDACKSPATSVTATVSAGPTVNVSASNTLVCAGQAATLLATGATNYTYNPGGVTSNPATFNPSSTTTYTVLGSSGSCSGSKLITINVSTCAGLTEQNVSIGMSLYPNPVKDYFIINNTSNDRVTMKMYDNTGKLVVEKIISQNTEQVDVSKLANGSYFVEILNSNNRIYKATIVKQ